jgi:3D (Asp-Asp-Asp) domain-containing protein
MSATYNILKLFMFVVMLSSCQQFSSLRTYDYNTNKVLPVIRTTAYCKQEKDHLKYKNKSALGTELKNHLSIASDWSRLPVHTKLKIEGKIYEVTDYGRAMVNRPLKEPPTIDVYQPNRREMNKWGVKMFNNIEIVQFGDYYESARILKERLRYDHCRKMYNRILDKLN